MKMHQVAVFGAGTMGTQIAQVVATCGHCVWLYDPDAHARARAEKQIDAGLSRLQQKGVVGPEQVKEIKDRLQVSADQANLKKATFAIEAVPEQMAIKQSVFALMDEMLPAQAVMATNTSALSVTQIAAATSRPWQVVGLHFFNPVWAMKLVEIIKGAQTSPEVLEQASAFCVSLEKQVIVVKDSPGFATSRLGICLAFEAMRMLESGVASAQDIDTAMTLGYGHPVGPLRLTDRVGLDVRLAIGEHLRHALDDPRFEPPAILKQKVAQGHLGQKSGHGFYDWE